MGYLEEGILKKMANETNNTKSMSSVLPWIIAAIVLFILPFIFTGGGSITIMNQIGNNCFSDEL